MEKNVSKRFTKPELKRGKSLLGPRLSCKYGPKASYVRAELERDYEVDPLDRKLKWNKPPENALIVKKTGTDTTKPLKELATWLMKERDLHVFVLPDVLKEEAVKEDLAFTNVYHQLQVFNGNEEIDFVICLGGDGTLLYATSLFQHSMPPVISFHLGSLGFLTTHKIEDYQTSLIDLLDGSAVLLLRSRLRCIVERYI